MNVAAVPLTLRLARADHVDPSGLAELLNDAYRKYPFMTVDRTSAEVVGEEAAGGDFILAESGGEMTGCAFVRSSLLGEWWEGADDYRHAGALYFGYAAVARNAQGKGVGRRLVAEAERLGQERNFQRMILTTLEEMGNVRYYEGLGYRSVSQHGFETGHWGMTIPHTHHVMVKDLPLRVRVARSDEAGAVAALVNHAYRVEDFFIDGDRTTAEEVVRRIASERFLVVDGADGSLVAAVHVSLRGPVGYFGMLSVSPAHQRFGIGARLVAAAEEFCAEQGCSQMELTAVNLREELPPWYARLGYTVVGTAPWPTEDTAKLKTEAHFIVMNKPLAPLVAGHESRR